MPLFKEFTPPPDKMQPCVVKMSASVPNALYLVTFWNSTAATSSSMLHFETSAS